MTTGIVAKKKQQRTKEYDSRARRYVFFALHPVDFSGSQATTPVWKPKMPKGRLVLLEEFSYWPNAESETSEDPIFQEGAGLVETSMGTDAQVSYILSQFATRGFVEIKSITDLAPEVAAKVDELLFGEPYEDLYELRSRLQNFKSEGEDISELANLVAKEALASVEASIAWAGGYCSELDREVQEGRAGRRGRTQVNAYDKYMYKMVRRQVPAGFDAPPQPKAGGGDLAELVSLLKEAKTGGVDIAEFEALKESYEASLKTIKSLQRSLEAKTK